MELLKDDAIKEAAAGAGISPERLMDRMRDGEGEDEGRVLAGRRGREPEEAAGSYPRSASVGPHLHVGNYSDDHKYGGALPRRKPRAPEKHPDAAAWSKLDVARCG